MDVVVDEIQRIEDEMKDVRKEAAEVFDRLKELGKTKKELRTKVRTYMQENDLNEYEVAGMTFVIEQKEEPAKVKDSFRSKKKKQKTGDE